jgi:hypothetical protein
LFLIFVSTLFLFRAIFKLQKKLFIFINNGLIEKLKKERGPQHRIPEHKNG